jgi:hypothetical protein
VWWCIHFLTARFAAFGHRRSGRQHHRHRLRRRRLRLRLRLRLLRDGSRRGRIFLVDGNGRQKRAVRLRCSEWSRIARGGCGCAGGRSCGSVGGRRRGGRCGVVVTGGFVTHTIDFAGGGGRGRSGGLTHGPARRQSESQGRGNAMRQRQFECENAESADFIARWEAKKKRGGAARSTQQNKNSERGSVSIRGNGARRGEERSKRRKRGKGFRLSRRKADG